MRGCVVWIGDGVEEDEDGVVGVVDVLLELPLFRTQYHGLLYFESSIVSVFVCWAGNYISVISLIMIRIRWFGFILKVFFFVFI